MIEKNGPGILELILQKSFRKLVLLIVNWLRAHLSLSSYNKSHKLWNIKKIRRNTNRKKKKNIWINDEHWTHKVNINPCISKMDCIFRWKSSVWRTNWIIGTFIVGDVFGCNIFWTFKIYMDLWCFYPRLRIHVVSSIFPRIFSPIYEKHPNLILLPLRFTPLFCKHLPSILYSM